MVGKSPCLSPLSVHLQSDRADWDLLRHILECRVASGCVCINERSLIRIHSFIRSFVHSSRSRLRLRLRSRVQNQGEKCKPIADNNLVRQVNSLAIVQIHIQTTTAKWKKDKEEDEDEDEEVFCWAMTRLWGRQVALILQANNDNIGSSMHHHGSGRRHLSRVSSPLKLFLLAI